MGNFTFETKRSIGDLVNDTFTLIRENTDTLGRAFLMIALVPFVASSVFMTGVSGDTLRSVLSPENSQKPEIILQKYAELLSSSYLWTGVVLSIVGYFLLYAVTLTWLRLKKNNEPHDVSAIWRGITGNLTDLLTSIVGGGLLFMVIFFLLLMAFTLLAGVIATFGSVLVALLSCLFMVVLIPTIFFFAGLFQLFLAVRQEENTTLIHGITRSLQLSKGRYFQLLGFAIVLYLILFILSLLFSIPGQIVIFSAGLSVSEMGMLWKILFFIANIIANIGSLAYVMFIIGFYLYYFNLAEEKENPGLSSRLDAMFETKDPDVL